MRHDEKVFLIGEDVGIPGGFGGAFGVYLGLPEEFGHDRIIDTPISEKAIAGAAVGAALMGMRPIADLQYADFLFECMDELVNQAAKMRYMSNGKLSVPMVMRCPVGTANRGAQHGQCPESYFVHVPGLESRLRFRRVSRQGTAEERGARQRSRALLRAQAALRQQGTRAGRWHGSHRARARGGVLLPDRQSGGEARGHVGHRGGDAHEPLPLARGRRGTGAGRHRLRGDRSADAAPARRGDDLRVSQEDRPSRDRPRGHAHRRMGRRACGAESPRSASSRWKRRSGESRATTSRCRSPR